MTKLLDAKDKEVCYVAKFNNSQDIEEVKEIVGAKQVIPQLITHAIGGFLFWRYTPFLHHFIRHNIYP